jgi:hypothetical protein
MSDARPEVALPPISSQVPSRGQVGYLPGFDDPSSPLYITEAMCHSVELKEPCFFTMMVPCRYGRDQEEMTQPPTSTTLRFLRSGSVAEWVAKHAASK